MWLLEGEQSLLALINEISCNRDLISSLPNDIVLHHIGLILNKIFYSNGMDDQWIAILLSLSNVNKAWRFLTEKSLGGLALKVHEA